MSDWQQQRADWLRFVATPAGKAFEAFDRLVGNAWSADLTSHNDKRISEAWTKANTARDALIAEIKKLQEST